MREFSINYSEALKVGLRPESEADRNIPFFSALSGMKPTGYGLVAIPAVATTAVITALVSWPHPQLFQGKSKSLLADATALYTVNTSTWAKTAVTLFNPDDSGDAATITSGGPWHFVDFFDTYVLLNGTTTVFHNNRRIALGQSDRTYAQDTVGISTGCDFRGIAVFGGFSSYWSSEWQSFWDSWKAQASPGLVGLLNEGVNFVAWSSIGGGDMLWPITYAQAISGLDPTAGCDESLPFLFEMMKSGQAGFMPMPFQGTVRALKALEKGIVVYCDGGIGFLYPVTVGDLPTFGYRTISSIGIMNRGAVAGDEQQHVYVDQFGSLCRLTGDLQVTRAYQELFDSFDSTVKQVAVCWSPTLREFHISDGVTSYVFTETGLAAQNQRLTSIVCVNGVEQGVAAAASTQSTLAATTNTFDCGNRGIKQLAFVELGYTGLSNLVVTPYYRNSGTSWTAGSAITANAEGVAYLGLSGVDFRLGISATTSANAKLDSIVVKYKQSDKRFIRGL